jgi:hypothetical protein
MDERRTRGARGGDPQGADADILAPGLVHELRQPLTGLDAGLRLVERELGSSVTGLDGWKIAASQVARLRETLETYQQLMSPGAAEQRAFAVEPIVRRAVESVRHRLEGGRDRVAVVIEEGVPQAHGSPQALLHALTNLLANAIDAVAETGAPGRIEARALRVADGVPRAQVRIADEGVGIPPERRRLLFRARYTTKPRGSGSGLGLAIGRRMLRRAGGELRLALPDDPARRPWARTEFVVDLSAGEGQPVAQEPPPPRRGALASAAPAVALGAALLVAVGVGWAGFRSWIRAGDEPRPVAVAAAPEAVEILDVEGRIERLRGEAWEPVASGERLQPDDTLRTGAASGGTLAIGSRSRLVVSEATQLTVREVTTAVQRMRLTRGRISVDHQPDGARVLVIESAGGDSVARAGAARFSVLASGTALAVATETGAVRLQSAGRTVDVAAGQQSVSFRGRAPSEARAVPIALLLRVARSAREAGDACVIEGTVDPGAEVRVDGRLVDAEPHGRFAVRLPRVQGRTHATVVTRDAAGRVAQRRVGCAADEGVSDFAVRWGQDAPAPKSP